MKFDLNLMKARVLEIADPSNSYNQSDFDKEFGSGFGYVNTTQDYRLPINFVNESNNQDPNYETSGASGFDLRANLVSCVELILEVGKRAIVPTGLYFELPENFELQIRARSGLAAKNGVTVLNGVGTIDADYRGEVKVILINLGDEDFIIKNGDRIAQGIISTVTAKNSINLTRVDTININTERGIGGFGSTGIQ